MATFGLSPAENIRVSPWSSCLCREKQPGTDSVLYKTLVFRKKGKQLEKLSITTMEFYSCEAADQVSLSFEFSFFEASMY